MDCLDFLAVQGTLKSLLQHHGDARRMQNRVHTRAQGKEQRPLQETEPHLPLHV